MAIVIDGSSSAGTVNLGTNGTISNVAVGGLPDGIVDTDMLAANAVTAAKAAGRVSGITEADQWRVTANFTGTADPIASNWERVDTRGQTHLGTGMTESSGIFTFPSTGYWMVHFHVAYRSTTDIDYCGANIKNTTNNSSYDHVSFNYGFIADNSGDNSKYIGSTTQALIDVTDTTNCKVRFMAEMESSNCTASGSSDYSRTGAIFWRIGAT